MNYMLMNVKKERIVNSVKVMIFQPVPDVSNLKTDLNKTEHVSVTKDLLKLMEAPFVLQLKNTNKENMKLNQLNTS